MIQVKIIIKGESGMVQIKLNKFNNEFYKDVRVNDTYEKVIRNLNDYEMKSDEEFSAIRFLINFIKKDRDHILQKFGGLKHKLDTVSLDRTLGELFNVLENDSYSLIINDNAISNSNDSESRHSKKRLYAKINLVRQWIRFDPSLENLYRFVKPMIKNIKHIRNGEKDFSIDEEELYTMMSKDLINMINEEFDYELVEIEFEDIKGDFDIIWNQLFEYNIFERI